MRFAGGIVRNNFGFALVGMLGRESGYEIFGEFHDKVLVLSKALDIYGSFALCGRSFSNIDNRFLEGFVGLDFCAHGRAEQFHGVS